jgi:hypothetical protein
LISNFKPLTYRFQSSFSSALAATETVRKAAEGSASTQDYLDLVDNFANEVDLWSIEYCTVVDKDFKIRAVANTARLGELFDPSGAASKVFELNSRIIVSVQMTHDEFMQEGAKRFL